LVAGRLVFTRTTVIFPSASDDDNFLIPGQTEAIVAADGILSVPLYAGNDPAASPTGWTYDVRPDFPGWKKPFVILVPFDAPGGEIDLNDLAPVPQDGTGELYALVAHTHPGGGSVTYGAVSAQTTYGLASNSGSEDSISRSDHRHGTPALPTPSAIGAPSVFYWNGSAYVAAPGAGVYVGGSGPVSPVNGDVVFST
jgi:hypothetical protein